MPSKESSLGKTDSAHLVSKGECGLAQGLSLSLPKTAGVPIVEMDIQSS